MRNNYLKNRYYPNLCISLVRKAKLDYYNQGFGMETCYNKRNHMKVSDNKTFWKTVKSFFTDKGVNQDRILLTEENNNEISEKLNNLRI